MQTTLRYLTLGLFIFAGSFVPAPAAVMVDIGSGTVQSGWTGWSPSISTTAQTINLNLDGDDFTASLQMLTTTTSPTGIAVASDSSLFSGSGVTGTGIDDVLDDTVLYGAADNSATGNVYTLTLSNLDAGTYTWTGYHHKAVTSGNARDLISVFLTDASNTGLEVVDNLAQTRNDDLPNFAQTNFNFTSNGTDSVVLLIENSGGANQDEVFLNGFQVAVVPEPGAGMLLFTGAGLAIWFARRRRA